MCWLTDVVIQIVCALIGGGLTMWGVQKTLKAQRSESDRIRIQEAKPYLFAEHPMRAPVWDSIPQLLLKSAEDDSCDYALQCYVKNSDNGIAIVKKVTTDNHTYIPTEGNVVDKDCVTGLNIFLVDKTETMRGWKLFVEDIYGDEYCYLMILDRNMLNIGACVESEKSQKGKVRKSK
mgnify:FL=1